MKRKQKQVRPAFLIAMGIALLGFGLISGIAIDLATRPNEGPKAQSPQRRAELAGPRTDTATVHLEHPTGEPVRAWAPEMPAATPPLVVFAVPTRAPPTLPVVAIVIDDMGVDRARSLRMTELRAPLTLSLMTYAEGLPELVDRARHNGHEIMAHLPMEPVDPNEDPGRGALRVNMDPGTIRKMLAADLDSWSGYVGINNHMGSKFTTDRERMDVVMSELKARGLLWLDSKTTPGSAGTAAAQASGVPYVERDVFIDNEQTADAILAQLAEAEKVAKSRGSAIAIGHPHDATFEALRQWLPSAEARGLALVPVTEVLRRRSSPP